MNWEKLFKGKVVQEKYEIFLGKYREGVQQFVPSYKVKIGKHEWYNARCVETKKKKDRGWKKMVRKLNRNTRVGWPADDHR